MEGKRTCREKIRREHRKEVLVAGSKKTAFDVIARISQDDIGGKATRKRRVYVNGVVC